SFDGVVGDAVAEAVDGAGGRADVDDRAASAVFDEASGVFHAEPHAGLPQGDDAVPAVVPIGVQGGGTADGGMVDAAMKCAVPGVDAVDGGLPIVVVADVQW